MTAFSEHTDRGRDGSAGEAFTLYTAEKRRGATHRSGRLFRYFGAAGSVLSCITGVGASLSLDGRSAIATLSILAKTAALYLIMITGAIWEKVVFGQYLFAPAFFWEDVVSFVVIALHSLYIFGLFTGSFSPTLLVSIALVAYAAYVVNAAQFLWKLRQARLQSEFAHE